MTYFRLMTIALLFLAMFACKTKEPATPMTRSNPGYESGSSVYDNNNNGSDTIESGGEIQADSIGYDYTDSDIESTEIGNMSQTARGNLDLNWEPIFFAFDESNLSDSARRRLADHAQVLMENPNLHVLLEGHCDVRGTPDYNLALGERRAQAVKHYLVQLGVPGNRLKTISYGELKPLVPGDREDAWARNRRVAFTF